MNTALEHRKSPGADNSLGTAPGETLGARLKEMMALHPRAPAAEHGRLTWLRNELEEVSGVKVSLETVRKWAADETIPRPSKMPALAKALDVDEAWLSLGRKPTLTVKETRHEVRSAQSASLYVAGILGMAGVNLAFADEKDETGTHLYAISSGYHVPVCVALAEESDGKVTVSLDGVKGEQVTLAVLPRGRDTFLIFDVTQAEFAPRGGHCAAVFTLEDGALKQTGTDVVCPRVTNIGKIHKLGK
jgi:transcriptional regulator with XRE-family HTH domain